LENQDAPVVLSEPKSTPGDDFIISPDYASDYLDVLQSIHQHLMPKRYLEIGTLSGVTLSLAECASLAVDPLFQIERDVVGKKPACLMYQMTSDDFFVQFDPKSLLGGPIDFAFLDGLHWFEYLLRDFINTEKHCARNSLIMLHDCIPTDHYVARRNLDDDRQASLSTHPDWWAGDVWKAVVILLKYRPDLVIYGSEISPTGLIAITNLDPASTFLEENYFRVVKECQENSDTDQSMKAYRGSLVMIEPDELMSHDLLARRFWF
jgi:hypothetical protein